MNQLERARWYRSRADEIRGVVNGVSDPMSRRSLIELADSYDALAQRLEAGLRSNGDSGPTRHPGSERKKPQC